MKKKTTLLKTTFFAAAFLMTGHFVKAQTPIAYYKFNNSLNDETTNWNLSQRADFEGTLTYVEGVDGTANGAVSGFGGADYLETATNFSISGNDSRTMAAWVKTSSTTTQAIVGMGTASTATRWTFQLFSNKPRLEVQGRGFNGAAIVTDGNWHHIATVYDSSGTATLYVDGVEDGTRDWSATALNTTPMPLRVANDYNNEVPNRNFEGAIDELRIYDTALTSTEIASIYSTSLSNNHITATNFNTYPNPVKDKLFFTNKNVASVEVFNSVGALVISKKVTNYIDMQNLAQGIYFVNFKDANGTNLKAIKAVKL